jgi:hypothetical protein
MKPFRIYTKANDDTVSKSVKVRHEFWKALDTYYPELSQERSMERLIAITGFPYWVKISKSGPWYAQTGRLEGAVYAWIFIHRDIYKLWLL